MTMSGATHAELLIWQHSWQNISKFWDDEKSTNLRNVLHLMHITHFL